jgi:hypothetical protein
MPAPMMSPGSAPKSSDLVNMNTLGSSSQQFDSAQDSGSQAPATFSGTPAGMGSTLASWNNSLNGTQANLSHNPLSESFHRIEMGQRLSNPDTNGIA